MDRNITLFLIRHGETEENRLRILQGHLPGTLTPEGVEAARERAEDLANAEAPFDLLLCSDLLRAHRTACIIGERLHLAVRPTPLLRERDWGDFTGEYIPSLADREWPANVESAERLLARARNFLTWVRVTYPDQVVVAVGHGIINKAIQSVYHQRPMSQIMKMTNAEMRVLML